MNLTLCLEQGCRSLSLSVNAHQLSQLEKYIVSLMHWNQAMNLTAFTDPITIAQKGILDSLAITPYLLGDRIIDVGSGAGMPGLPLAIIKPQRHFVLLDARQKRCQFLLQMVHQLQLSNVEVVHSRVEDYYDALFSSILTRAFAPLSIMLEKTQHLCEERGIFLAMKGELDPKELSEMPDNFVIEATDPLVVPNLVATRHLVQIKRRHK